MRVVNNFVIECPFRSSYSDWGAVEVSFEKYYREQGLPLLPLFACKGFSRPYCYANRPENWFYATSAHCTQPDFDLGTVVKVFAEPFMHKVRASEIAVPEFDLWVAKFPKNRADMLRKAYYSQVPDPRHSSFVKKDKQILDEFKVPRVVNASSDETIATLGPWYSGFSDQMKRHFVKESTPILWASGTNGEHIGTWFNKWMDIIQPEYYVCTDMSKFDRSVNYVMLTWEWSEYFQAMRKREKSAYHRYFDDQIIVRMQGINGFGSAVRIGGRSTGALNTSVGNTMIHTHILTYFCKLKGYRIGKDVAFCLLGDDMLCISRVQFDIDSYKEFVRKLGWVCKGKITKNLSEVDFCQKLFYPTKQGYMPGPKIGRYLAKTGWSFKKINIEDVFYSEDINHVPILNKLPGVCKNRTYKDWELHNTTTHEMTEETDKFFFSRYGFFALGRSWEELSDWEVKRINQIDNDHEVENKDLNFASFQPAAVTKLLSEGVKFGKVTKKKHLKSIILREINKIQGFLNLDGSPRGSRTHTLLKTCVEQLSKGLKS